MSRRSRYPITLLLPALAVFGLFFIVPTLTGFYYSFTDWNIHADKVEWVGLKHYREMLTDRRIEIAFKNTLVFAALVTVLQNLCGLGLALVLNETPHVRNLLRTIFFSPYVIAPIVIGYIFRALYHPRNGMVNRLLEAVGLGGLTTDWLNNPSVALYAIVATDIWRVAGFSMVIYLAGLQTVPQELKEAASIDGAGWGKRFRYVVFPLLAPSFTVNVLVAMISSMKVFEIVMVLTEGGPGYATEVFYTYIRSTFSLGIMGYSTAINVVLFLLVTAIGLPVLHFLRKREVEL